MKRLLIASMAIIAVAAVSSAQASNLDLSVNAGKHALANLSTVTNDNYVNTARYQEDGSGIDFTVVRHKEDDSYDISSAETGYDSSQDGSDNWMTNARLLHGNDRIAQSAENPDSHYLSMDAIGLKEDGSTAYKALGAQAAAKSTLLNEDDGGQAGFTVSVSTMTTTNFVHAFAVGEENRYYNLRTALSSGAGNPNDLFLSQSQHPRAIAQRDANLMSLSAAASFDEGTTADTNIDLANNTLPPTAGITAVGLGEGQLNI